MLLAEGWNSPRATVVMHLAPTASKRVYQQRIGRIMRIHPRKEAGIVVDFVPEGRDAQRARRLAALAARRRLLPRGRARHAGAAAPDAAARAAQADAGDRGSSRSRPTSARRLAVIQREWQRVDPKYLDEDEQRFWATIAGRQMRFDERQAFVQKFTEQRRVEGRARDVPRRPAPRRTRTGGCG